MGEGLLVGVMSAWCTAVEVDEADMANMADMADMAVRGVLERCRVDTQ